jgi:Asp-tRNA(Asn)/Glu-tRNA(Gln) amidotransferase A subunit family amidase
MESDLALSFAPEYDEAADRLSVTLRGMLERGRRYLAIDYNRAVARIPLYNAALEDVFQEFHALLTPAATGEAPKGLESTGSPVFCTLWTLCGLPAVTLPLMQGASGMPIGVQLVGRAGDDARLLQYANWLVGRIEGGTSA